MKLHQLRILDAVARQRNVTLAANELGISQPAVSLQLKRLEEEFATRFYERNKQGIALTRQGAAFREAIRPILDQVDRVEHRFKSSGNSKPTDTFTVGSNYLYSVMILPEILSDFIARHQEVQCVMETDSSFNIEQRVVGAEVEVALISKPSFIPECIYEAYEEDEAVAFVASGENAECLEMTLEDLEKKPLVVTRDSACLRDLIAGGFNPKLALQCDTPDSVKLAVKRGVGVGLLFKTRVNKELGEGEFTLLDVPEVQSIRRTAFIVYDPRRPYSILREDFIRTMRQKRTESQSALLAVT